MKKIIYICMVVTMICVTCLRTGAQSNESNIQQPAGGRLESYKIAYLTKMLNLSPEEAQRFWPVYNQYSNEIRETRQNARQSGESEITTEEKVLNIRKKYNGDFVKALGSGRANDFFKAEKQFGLFVNKELMERKENRMMQQRRGGRQ
jgi:hypothetical protein